MSRRRTLLEPLVVYTTIQAALWTTGPPRAVAITAVYIEVLASVFLIERARLSELGLGLSGLRPSLWVMPAAFALGAIMVLIAWRLGSLHGLTDEALGWRVLAYIPWALAQQFAAQCFFFRRIEALLGSGMSAVIATAVLFAGAHVPNPILMAATVIAEFLWTLAYRRYRNLYAISLAHGLLAVAVAVSVPVAWHHSMRVGIGYLRYRAS
jgi:membrane protease YdiL (CAAX protease family)